MKRPLLYFRQLNLLNLLIPLLLLYYGYNLRSFLDKAESITLFQVSVRPISVFGQVYRIPFLSMTPPSKIGWVDQSLTTLRQWGHILRYTLREQDERLVSASVGGLTELNFRKEIFFHWKETAGLLQKEVIPQIRSLTQEFERKGVRFLVLPVPMKSTLYRENLPLKLPEPQGFQLELRNYKFLSESRASVYQELNKASPNVVDLFTRYEELRRSNLNTEIYLPSDFHWTVFGATQAVAAIVEKLRIQGLPLQSPVIHHRGYSDQAHYNYYLLNTYQLPTSFLAKKTALQWREALYTLDALTPKPLFNRVIVLGSSMCKHREETGFDFPSLLSMALNQKVIKFCTDGAALDGAFKLLKESQMKLEANDLVVWEFYSGDLPHDGNISLPSPEFLLPPMDRTLATEAQPRS